jgi:ParB-like chromosome segregation protein Spo0J
VASSSGPRPPWRIETWGIDRLHAHPQQAALFHDLQGAEFDDLTAGIRRVGIKDPIDATPEGKTLDGHQRLRIARLLGLTEVPVRARYDLAGDENAIDLAHLRANRSRRQLHPLDKVRLERREMELELGRRWADFSKKEQEQLIDRLHQKYGYSERHARRLINILVTPMAIQAEVSRGRLPQVKADQVSRVGWSKQVRIGEEIEAGGDPAVIVARYLPGRRRPPKADVAYRRLMAELERTLDDLEGREDEIDRFGPKAERDLAVFERLGRFRENVEAMLGRRREEWRRPLEDFEMDFAYRGATNDLDPAD